MPRPSKQKHLEDFPRPVIYMPSGWTKHNVPTAEISVEDFEAFRLVDGEGCNLDEAARRMHSSRSTVGRMLERARRILAQAMAEKAPICVDAGDDSNFSIIKEEIGPVGELAAAVESDALESSIARMFGRAPYFAIYKSNGKKAVTFLPNPGHSMKRGAAKAAVRYLLDAGVRRVAAGRFGPDALQALAEARIEPLLLGHMNLVQFQKMYLKS
jgi:predicted DNA-binding protein (UPF0251 family)/predicted Fe-Mo cluster-binding NifX family protein